MKQQCPKCGQFVCVRLAEHGREPDEMVIPCEGTGEIAMGDNGILTLLADLTDPDECWFDHLGHCQAHSWLNKEPCPHGLAQELLKRIKKSG
jgi:hypothetical protein